MAFDVGFGDLSYFNRAFRRRPAGRDQCRAQSDLRFIVGTYRDFELQPARPLAQTIDELIRFHPVERISLSGLPRAAVADATGPEP